MKFTAEIDMDNAAFTDEPFELPYILIEVAKQVSRGSVAGSCRDWNGNKVGGWKITKGGN